MTATRSTVAGGASMLPGGAGQSDNGPPGIFPWSGEWFRAVADFAHGTPSWLHTAAETGTEAGLLLFPLLFIAAWWRARSGDARSMALALLAPVVTVGAYLVSETVKSQVLVARPCRAVPDVVTIANCPPTGDWSFPSNHATVAAAAAMAVVLSWRPLAAVAFPAAGLMALSRVFVGVHYPHDVVAGFLLGVTVAPLLALVLIRPLTPLVALSREQPALRPLLAGSRAEVVGGG